MGEGNIHTFMFYLTSFFEEIIWEEHKFSNISILTISARWIGSYQNRPIPFLQRKFPPCRKGGGEMGKS